MVFRTDRTGAESSLDLERRSATGGPYSLAILSTRPAVAPDSVLASDIDQGAIAIAKRGHYLKRQLVNVPRELVSRYFTTADGGETYLVNSEVKARVSFQRLNLIEDSFSDDFDLILCRNVVIYFSSETKTALYHKFLRALRPGGYLLVGSTEQIFDFARSVSSRQGHSSIKDRKDQRAAYREEGGPQTALLCCS